jgi:cullin-associated NEDD8-dissociated protein 1
MLTKLIHLARGETQRRLDNIADCFKATLSQKPKENAVKQELEKHHESIRSTMRATLTLNGEFGGLGTQQKRWTSYWDWAKTAFIDELQALEAEEREV